MKAIEMVSQGQKSLLETLRLEKERLDALQRAFFYKLYCESREAG